MNLHQILCQYRSATKRKSQFSIEKYYTDKSFSLAWPQKSSKAVSRWVWRFGSLEARSSGTQLCWSQKPYPSPERWCRTTCLGLHWFSGGNPLEYNRNIKGVTQKNRGGYPRIQGRNSHKEVTLPQLAVDHVSVIYSLNTSYFLSSAPQYFHLCFK